MPQPLDWPPALAYAAAFVFGYLCGSIPFGLLLTRLAGGPDIRAIGSGNIGATNVLRTGRKGLAAATLIGDMLKGTVAVLLAAAVLGKDAADRGSARRVSRPPVSGLARTSAAARAWRPISACSSASPGPRRSSSARSGSRSPR